MRLDGLANAMQVGVAGTYGTTLERCLAVLARPARDQEFGQSQLERPQLRDRQLFQHLCRAPEHG